MQFQYVLYASHFYAETHILPYIAVKHCISVKHTPISHHHKSAIDSPCFHLLMNPSLPLTIWASLSPPFPQQSFYQIYSDLMSFQNGFLQLSAAARRPMGIIRPAQKHQTSHRFFLNTQRQRTPSSIEAYPQQPKDLSIKEIIHEKYLALQKRKQKSLPHTFQANKNAFALERNSNQHISKTIDSVNEYAEQLRLTLIKQYKAQKMKSIRTKKAKGHDEPLSAGAEFQTLDCNNDPKATKPKEENHRNPAYKTLNLLYQAIIDNSFRSRRKEGFQLLAVRLPIVDRFNNRTETIRHQRQINSLTKQDHIKRDEQSWTDATTNYSPFQKTKATFHTHKIQWKHKGKTHRALHEDSQIVPWMVEQEANYQ